MLLQPGTRFRAAWILLLCLVLGLGLSIPVSASAPTIKVAVDVSVKGGFVDFNIHSSSFPMTVDYSVNDLAPGATVKWQFGDGTTSDSATPAHAYSEPCVYRVTARVAAPNGTVLTGGLLLGVYSSKGPSGALEVCPSQGTAGFTSVELSGIDFSPSRQVNLTLDGVGLGTVKADSGGDFIFNATDVLSAQPNGTQYDFTSVPRSLTGVFTTVEGIRVSPMSGGPGNTTRVEGRSYPPDSSVLVYLGGVELGTAQTSGNGSFSQVFTIPFASPLTTAGTYPFSSVPPSFGTTAEFTSSGGVPTPPPPLVSTPWWLWLLVVMAAVVAVLVVVVLVLWRRRPREQDHY